MDKRSIGIIGFGQRGKMMVELLLDHFCDNYEITGVCDVAENRAKEAADLVGEKLGSRPAIYMDYKELISAKPDVIFVFASWHDHIRMCCDIMEAGIPLATEVGGSNSIADCHNLVETWERTKTPYMFLENCCFGRLEQFALSMKNNGVLGKIVYCEGGYCHDLREEVCGGARNNHYRLSEYAAKNCDNYPSHDFLPIAKLLGLNQGNRPISLYSYASGSNGLKAYVQKKYPDDALLSAIDIRQADIVTTIISFAQCETVLLSLDTTLPRPYSRRFTVRGTKGAIFEDTMSVFIDGVHNEDDFEWNKQWNNVEEYYKQYDSEIWKVYRENPIGSHDGMDYLELKAFFEALDNKKEMPVNVYDAAFTMALTPLTEMSISMNMPVAIPDFSNGKWVKRYENQ